MSKNKIASSSVKMDQIESMLKQIKQQLKYVCGVRVGWLKEPHKDRDGKIKTMESVVLSNEFGTLTQPPRPFIRPTRKKRYHNWVKLANLLISKEISLKEILLTLGEQVKNDLKDAITHDVPPPNSPYTIKKKGSDKTLRDTGAMLGSIHSELIKTNDKLN